MKTVYIDFDKTICPNGKGNEGDPYPPPTAECLETFDLLRKSGYKIVIYSVRSNANETNKPGGHNSMIEYLSEHKVPYDAFNSDKSHFSFLIDDKCLGCPVDDKKNVDWARVQEMLRENEYV